jgi:protein-S-isoprenylcysteine O-methyltransferase Ste14
MDTKSVLLVAFIGVLFAGRIAASYVSRKYGAKEPTALTAEGWKIAFKLLKSKEFIPTYVLELALLINGVVSILEESYVLSLASLGLVLMILGVYLNFIGRRDLARYFTPFTAPGGKLVKTGIYARIRHPIYSAFMVMSLGMALVAANAAGFLLFVFVSIALLARVRREEKKLVAKFGKAYKDYAKKTPAFVPRLPPG